jgi:hypothetical protein
MRKQNTEAHGYELYNLFENNEVNEMGKIKLTILGIAVFVGAVFVGWVMNIAPKIIMVMDMI